jgi:hypothetical protein
MEHLRQMGFKIFAGFGRLEFVEQEPIPKETCPRIYRREIFGFFEPYCVSAGRRDSVPVAIQESEIHKNFCCTKAYNSCPYYRRKEIMPPQPPARNPVSI